MIDRGRLKKSWPRGGGVKWIRHCHVAVLCVYCSSTTATWLESASCRMTSSLALVKPSEFLYGVQTYINDTTATATQTLDVIRKTPCPLLASGKTG